MVELSCNELQSYFVSMMEDLPALQNGVDVQAYARKLTSNVVAFAEESGRSTNGQPVYAGIVAGYFNNVTEGFSYISFLHVRPDCRKEHIGRMLMDKALAYSKERGLDMVKLHVNKTNDNAIGFYVHLGFDICAETERQFEMQFKIQ